MVGSRWNHAQAEVSSRRPWVRSRCQGGCTEEGCTDSGRTGGRADAVLAEVDMEVWFALCHNGEASPANHDDRTVAANRQDLPTRRGGLLRLYLRL